MLSNHHIQYWIILRRLQLRKSWLYKEFPFSLHEASLTYTKMKASACTEGMHRGTQSREICAAFASKTGDRKNIDLLLLLWKKFTDIKVLLSSHLKIKIFTFIVSFLTFILLSMKIKWKNLLFLHSSNF